MSLRAKNDKTTVNDFDLGLKVCQTIWLLYKWGADGLQRFSSPCTLLILLMMFAEMDSALISAGLDGLDNLARWLFKSIIRGNEDTARRVKTREKVFIHYCHTHTRTHIPRGLRQPAVLHWPVCILWGACDDEQYSRLYIAAVLNSLNWALQLKNMKMALRVRK